MAINGSRLEFLGRPKMKGGVVQNVSIRLNSKTFGEYKCYNNTDQPYILTFENE